MPKIFISYRRDDSQHQAARLHDALKRHVRDPRRDIFIDVDNIPVGVDFVHHLDAKVAECDVLLALIGPSWLNSGASLFGKRRLDDPEDFVRIEIASALKRGIQVAPVLLDGAPMPKDSELPDDLKPLARRQGVQLRHETFSTDAERLVRGLNLKEIGKTPRAAAAQRKPAPGGGGWIAPVLALLVLALGGGGAWLWFADPLGWKSARAADAESSTAKGGGGGAPRSGVTEGAAGQKPADGSADTGAAQPAAPPPASPQQAAASPAPATPQKPAPPATPSIDPAAAKAQLEQAKANLAVADSQQKRIEPLVAKGMASQASLDQANADLAAAKANVAAAEKVYRNASGGTASTPVPVGRKPGETFRDCSDCPEMVVIPAGSFTMGSPSSESDRYSDEGPQRTVRIDYSFAVGKYEVTWAEYNACVSDGGCTRLQDDRFGGGGRPVTNVNWNEAKAYAAWLGRKTGKTYRLPSEAEWEYAARAGSTTAYPWGSVVGRNNANCNGCGSKWNNSKTAPVGSFSANAFGLHDMQGNVSEWVEDCYKDSYSAGQPSDGSAFTEGSCALRVQRGGSWGIGPLGMRSALRGPTTPAKWSYNSGFRLAKTLP